MEFLKWHRRGLLDYVLVFWVWGFLTFFLRHVQARCWRSRPGKLIDSGIMKSCRNINYFGELVIYLSFAILAMHWIPLLVLVLMMAIVWFPNMIRKDKSLSRYSEFHKYKKNSKLFIPYIFNYFIKKNKLGLSLFK